MSEMDGGLDIQSSPHGEHAPHTANGNAPTTAAQNSLATPKLGGIQRSATTDSNMSGRLLNHQQIEMSPHVKEKWRKVFRTFMRRERLKRMLAAWYQDVGTPCPRCKSMKLTESKFLIYEFSKHSRIKRSGDNNSDPKRDDPRRDAEELGEEGLEFGPKEFRLGSLQDLYSRRDTCPFCRLAVSSLKDLHFRGVTEGDEEKQAIAQAKVDCYASWQIDGRVFIRDKDGNITRSRACTRRIRLRWDYKGAKKDSGNKWLDTYIVLMAPKNTARGLFLGQPIEAVKSDAALVRRWVGFCEEAHRGRCEPTNEGKPLLKSFFGVIDVKQMCLTKLPEGGRYIALSYIWGKGYFNFQTKKANIRELRQPGGLRTWVHDCPRTIRDAIELVTDLGEQYLWVDALCIIQDSDRSWALNSKVMDVVYGNSYFTICAADGEDANAGLRALQSNSSRSEVAIQNIAPYGPHLRLMSTQPAENYLHLSKWNTRGWTFQERLLSRRNLIFASGRMWFQCQCTARSIDIITDDESAGWCIEFKDSPLLMLHKLPRQPLLVYKKSLELYMNRELTRPKDILAAFTGIGNMVCRTLGGTLIFGLPSSHFDWALLWEPRDAAVQRPDDDNEKFPTWSWCGWKNEIMEYKTQMLAGCEDNLHDWLMEHTWITWYIRDGNANLRLVWDGNNLSNVSPELESNWKGYSRPTKPNGDPHDLYGRVVKKDERDLARSDGFTLTLDECPYDVDILDCPDSQIPNSTEKDMPYLQFYTWSAFFRIREDRRFGNNQFGRKFRRYSIEDYKDDWCGTILLDKFWVQGRNFDNALEFIAISDAKEFGNDEYDDWANYIPLEKHESTWDLYYVLLIEHRMNIAYRVGLGKVYKEAFENSCSLEGKQWKEFILG